MAIRQKPASSVEVMQSDLDVLRDDVGKLAEQVTRMVGNNNNRENFVSDVKDRVSKVRSNIDELISEVGKRGRAAKEHAEAFVRLCPQSSVRDSPFTALALGMGIGIVVGLVWRR